MSDCYDLDKINSIIKIEGVLTNETPLRIGSGKAQLFTATTDNPILTIEDKPVIPGSSLKGALRSIAEAYMKSQQSEDKIKYVVHDITDHESPSCKKDEKEEIYCIPCILFGFHDISARVYIMDAIVEGDFSISQRTMVTINRVFGGQQHGHLYTLDFINPNAKFKLNMIVYNLDFINSENEEWKKKAVEVMRFLLKSLRDGIFIGGRKSVGYGYVKLIQANATLIKPNQETKTYDLMEVMKSW